jgi:hypothetical protein
MPVTKISYLEFLHSMLAPKYKRSYNVWKVENIPPFKVTPSLDTE